MMRFGKLTTLHVLLIAVAVSAVHGAPDPLEILRQSILSRTRVDFSGIRTVVVFEDGQKVHGVEQKIDCDAPNNLRIVVIAPEDQRGKLCLTVGTDHWEYNPGTGRAVHAELPPPQQVVTTRLSELNKLARRMKMQYVGADSIAGRSAHVVKVYTVTGIPVKKLWVDRQYYVELKTLRFNSHGQVKSSAYYTRIDYSPSFAPGHFAFQPPKDATIVEAECGTEPMPLHEAEEKAGFDALVPGYLPPGYRFLDDQASVITVDGKPTLWLTFSNGADAFSLFQRPASGSMNPHWRDRSVTWQEANYRFTLMGSLASDQLMKVKSSIRP